MIRWYQKRKRAVCLGDMGHAKLWYDPETENIWQAKTRWSLFTVPSRNDDLDSAIRMLRHVHMCELYVTKEEVSDA